MYLLALRADLMVRRCGSEQFYCSPAKEFCPDRAPCLLQCSAIISHSFEPGIAYWTDMVRREQPDSQTGHFSHLPVRRHVLLEDSTKHVEPIVNVHIRQWLLHLDDTSQKDRVGLNRFTRIWKNQGLVSSSEDPLDCVYHVEPFDDG